MSSMPYTATYGNEDLDVYAAGPDTRHRPLIVYVHGGAWRSESKEDHRDLALRLRDRTACPVAVLDYRLTNENELKHPGHAKDVLDALHFLIKWPDGAPYDHTRLFLVGHSAGAHIITSIFLNAASRAYLPDSLLRPDDALIRAVRGIALASGIYDIPLLLSTFPEYEKAFIRAAFRDPYHIWCPNTYDFHDHSRPVPWHIIHSTGDTLVDLAQSQAIYDHLTSLYEDAGWDPTVVTKDWTSLSAQHHYVNEAPFADLIAAWVLRHMHSYSSQ